jgi:glyoxylase-like metal-dependent hydrolase (beta-lactamase superfamily II)
MPYEVLRQVTDQAGVVLADNPSPMTLDGTNSWLLRDSPDRRSAILIDPGPDDDRHFDAILAASGSIELILLTHGHADHSEGARRLHEMTGAPVWALDPAHRYGGEGLVEGAVVSGSGVSVQVWATPGHTSDSLCFVLPAGEQDGPVAVLTGDTILGRGTTVVAHPDGVLADYLASLTRLSTLTGVAVLPGHGPELSDAGLAARQYLAHREQRLAQVRQALAAGGDQLNAHDVVERVYADVDRALWPAAELSVRAQLAYLHDADSTVGDGADSKANANSLDRTEDRP